jgi:hypothetical protein
MLPQTANSKIYSGSSKNSKLTSPNLTGANPNQYSGKSEIRKFEIVDGDKIFVGGKVKKMQYMPQRTGILALDLEHSVDT